MEQSGGYYVLRNPRLDMLPQGTYAHGTGWTSHFTQSEDFFIRVPIALSIPHFPIHHDVRIKTATSDYLRNVAGIFSQIHAQVPSIFEGLSWVFDPTEILRPLFATMYRVEQQNYLYLMRLDLTMHHQHAHVTQPGSNDLTPRYDTHDIFIEAELIPLSELRKTPDGLEFKVKQSISDTWVGETGRGYFVQGIWLDRDLTKFFSRLFAPTGKRLYPFYPFSCKYRAVCAQVVRLNPAGRKRTLALLQSARVFLESQMPTIENSIRGERFSEELEIFRKLKSLVGSNEISTELAGLEIRHYLNNLEQKEYELSFVK
jgi:hypothetical protein